LFLYFYSLLLPIAAYGYCQHEVLYKDDALLIIVNKPHTESWMNYHPILSFAWPSLMPLLHNSQLIVVSFFQLHSADTLLLLVAIALGYHLIEVLPSLCYGKLFRYL